MQEIAYTNTFSVNGQEVNFDDMTPEEKVNMADWLILGPLETLGNVQIRRTA